MDDSITDGKQLPSGPDGIPSALKGGGVIGIDFGATQLRAAIVTEHGVGPVEKRATPSQGNADDVWQALAELIQSVIDQNRGCVPAAICAGVPSVVDTVNGVVYDVQHIPACKELPLGRLISEKFGVLALVNNDANAFALGEYYFGEGRNKPVHPSQYSQKQDATVSNTPFLSTSASTEAFSLVGLTLGTGLGAGLILDGKLYSGPNCGAGEIGCLPYLDANLERYVSGAFFKKDGLDGKAHYKKALEGDPSALDLYKEFGFHLGQAVKITMYSYDPDMIVLGGTVSQAFDLFKQQMFEAMQDFDFPGILQKIQVYPSRIQNGAILGAASLYFDHVRHA